MNLLCRRVLSIVLTLMLVFTLLPVCPVSVYAAPGGANGLVSFSVKSADMSQVVLKVSLAAGSRITNGLFTVEYDPAVLSVNSCTEYNEGGATTVAGSAYGIDGQYNIAVLNSSCFKNAVVVAEITFDVLDATNNTVYFTCNVPQLFAVEAADTACDSPYSVTPAYTEYSCPAVIWNNADGVVLDRTSINIDIALCDQLFAAVTPSNARYKGVTWESSDHTVATVDSNGIVTGVAYGECTITVTTDDGGYTSVCTVKVNCLHDSCSFTETTPPSCTEAGSESGNCPTCSEYIVRPVPPLGHSGGTATCIELAVCEVCSVPYGEYGDHTYSSDYTVDIQPDCVTEGSKSRHCIICEVAFTDVTPVEVLGHDFGDVYTVDVEPTCDVAGSESLHCSRCDATDGSREVEPLGHLYAAEHTVDVLPKCDEYGMKSRHCTRDGCEDFTDVELIDPLGHDFSDEFTIDTEADCINEGSKSRHCSRCDSVTDVTPIERAQHKAITPATCTTGAYCVWCSTKICDPLDHDYSETFTVDVAPTCTTAGSISRHCSRCDAVTDVSNVPARHIPGAEATCTQGQYCTECDTLIAEALGHEFSDEWTIDTEATEETPGVKSHHCTRCDAKSDITIIPRIGAAVTELFVGVGDPALGQFTRINASLFGLMDYPACQLFTVVEPADANPQVTWSSDNEAVAVVSDSGLVTSVGIGSAVIKATSIDSGIESEFTISVGKRGDVDGNGNVNTDDARKALRCAVGLDSLDTLAMLCGNVDDKDGVTTSDARTILRVAVGLDSF